MSEEYDENSIQTYFTATSEENGTLRDSPLATDEHESTSIYSQDIINQKSIACKRFIDPKKLEEMPTKDIECQTFLQGVPTVSIPTEYKSEASQTMYMSSPCPPAQYFKNIIVSTNDNPMPDFMLIAAVQTMISIVPEMSQDDAIKYLDGRERNKKPWQNSTDVDTSTLILEILNFLLSRTFWISDPIVGYNANNAMKSQDTQTIIQYNYKLNSIVLDNETQTKLTCEPRHSNSKLLIEYKETKTLICELLRQCFVKGIESKIIIDSLIDELIEKGADRLKYPMKNQLIQTLASYKLHEDREEDVLKKLNIPIVVDPMEASIVVVPLIDDLLDFTCDQISQDARCLAKNIFDFSVQRVVFIGLQLAEIRKNSQPKSIEEILNRRRKKIVESLLKKTTETTATQTGLAGISEVMKMKKREEILCSVCARQSVCRWCLTAPKEEEEKRLPLEHTNILNTRDILLTYKPCYVMATFSEQMNNPHLQLTGLIKKKIEKPDFSQLTALQPVRSEKASDVSNQAYNVVTTPKKNIQIRDSFNGWTRIIDGTFAKSWSFKDPSSDATSITASRNLITRSISKLSQSECVLSSRSTRALQILKETFCTRDTCSIASPKILNEDDSISKCAEEKCVLYNLHTCKLLNLDRQHSRFTSNIQDQICARPRINKLKNILT